jgi:hypothetical protein
MSLDDALALAGQVLADYEVAGLDGAGGVDLIWTGRLAQALRDLAAAAALWFAGPAGDLSVEGLAASIRLLQEGAVRVEAQAVRLEVASTTVAAQPATPCGGRAGWRRLVVAWAGRVAGRGPQRSVRSGLEPGSVLLSAAEADTAWQAAADAAAWHAQYGSDCVHCLGVGRCADPVRHQAILAAYIALQRRLEAGRR